MVKVLVIKPSSLGDIIHAAGGVESIARRCPDCQVSWLVNEEYASFVSELPGVYEALPFPRGRFRRQRFPLWLPEVASWLRGLRRGFDVAVDLQGLQRSGLMARFSGARERFGPLTARELGWIHYNRRIAIPDELHHAVDRVNYLVEQVIARSAFLLSDGGGGPPPVRTFRMPVPPAAGDLPRAELGDDLGDDQRDILALCPGTRWPSKRWPAERWVELLELLGKRQPRLRPVFLGAPAEATSIEAIVGKATVPSRSLAGRIDLWGAAAVLESAVAAVTMDSAPLHLAAAVGTPTISLFGPTDPGRVAPRGPRHQVLRKDLDCLRCYCKECPLERRACLPDIGAEEVLEALEKVMG